MRSRRTSPSSNITSSRSSVKLDSVANSRPLGRSVRNLSEMSSTSVLDSWGSKISRYWVPSKLSVAAAGHRDRAYTTHVHRASKGGSGRAWLGLRSSMVWSATLLTKPYSTSTLSIHVFLIINSSWITSPTVSEPLLPCGQFFTEKETSIGFQLSALKTKQIESKNVHDSR